MKETSRSDGSRSAGVAVKHRITAVFALLVVMTVVATMAASPAFAGSQSFKFSQKGKGAEGVWTTCLDYPAANVQCVDTYVTASEYLVKADGTTFSGAGMFIDQYRYHFDRRGNFVFDSESFGWADANFSADQKLTSATATATVPLETCTGDRKGNYSCSDAGLVDVSASWTGVGDVTKVSGSFHVSSKSFTENYRFRGAFRDATGTASIDNTSLGDLAYAYIFNSTERYTSICHGC